ncbi:MAG: transglycosylase SLT domain-containing protein, partial [bacterium]
EESISNSIKNVSFYKDLFNNYEKSYLEKLVVKLFQKTSLNEVEDLLKILLDRYPAYDKVQYLMASLQEDKGDNSKALKYYKNIVNGFPKGQYYQRSLFKYAWIEMMNKNYSNSIDIFSRYIEEGKDNYDWSSTAALYFKSKCLDKKAKNEEAKLVRQELISSFPYSFYSLISMEEEGISLSEHIKSNIKTLDTTAEPISPMELKTLQTAIMLIRAGVSDMATKELSNINLDKLSPGYVEVVTNIYKHSANPDMTIMAAGKLMNILKGYASQEHAETHFPKLYFDNVKTYSQSYGFSPFVMLAIMKRESAFKKDAVSSSGALGLMQMMPNTAQTVDPKIKTKYLTDPDKNIKVAANYLNSLIHKYNSDLIYVLASYNAGDDALTRWINWYAKKYDKMEFIENIPYMETRNYVKAVIANYYMYNALYLKKDTSFKDILKIGE